MKKLFYFGLAALSLFEILKVYLIMPMPGSQEMDSVDTAYFLHTYRWVLRAIFGLLIVIGGVTAFQVRRKALPVISLIVTIILFVIFNFVMNADSMFKQPETLTFEGRETIQLSDSSLVIGVKHHEVVKAYPIRYLQYHHQVRDELNGKPIIATYCSVCRTGRVYEPIVLGKQEKFRLVGMDHFNAMFEDATTNSWWRQVSGEAIAGPLKGQVLPEMESFQLSLGKLFEQYPQALVMRSDDSFLDEYDTEGEFEYGTAKSKLIGTDGGSWNAKSWVIGVRVGELTKAYDWNELEQERVINDVIGEKPIVLVLGYDGQSFNAFERPTDSVNFTLRNDTLMAGAMRFDFFGTALNESVSSLSRLDAYQEFWHSWKTFHPKTEMHGK